MEREIEKIFSFISCSAEDEAMDGRKCSPSHVRLMDNFIPENITIKYSTWNNECRDRSERKQFYPNKTCYEELIFDRRSILFFPKYFSTS